MLDVCDGLELEECELLNNVDHALLGMELSVCAFYGTSAHHVVKTMKIDGVLE